MPKTSSIVFGADPLSLEDIQAVAKGSVTVSLNPDPAFRTKIQRGADFLDNLLRETKVIYGVTTGFGDSCTRGVPLDLVHELPVHLSRFHGCGLGDFLSIEQARAVIAVRLATLTTGMSGVTIDLLEHLVWLLEQDIIPVIPQEGSVGASGDLTPLSYLAAVLIGEREVFDKGQRRTAAEAHALRGKAPLRLSPKEALAIMNGTSVMTALACEAFSRAEYLSRLMGRLTAMTSQALLGNRDHFDKALFDAKPHPGQTAVAERIRRDLSRDHNPQGAAPQALDRLQDRYSVRCAPHVIGVLEDMLPTFRRIIETELNSANDNPIIDVDGERVLHGGHFYGGHIGFVMDSLKNLVANLADLADRQMATLVDVKFSNGLPPNLSGSLGERACINHGLKALQIGVSAWTAEALKNTMPASVFSRSTECHNQDKVSMGTIAARDCLRVLELTEQALVGHLIACVQAMRLRLRAGEINTDTLPQALGVFLSELEDLVPFIDEDQPLDATLRQLLKALRARQWVLTQEDLPVS
ncbi:MAG: HAL/PAL/TAL family ammonia-lyase [Magnetovibrionaceae bacterium]